MNTAIVHESGWGEDAEEVAHAAAERIRAFPDTWDQKQWIMHPLGQRRSESLNMVGGLKKVFTDPSVWAACGTTACVAGHVVAAAAEMGFDLREEEEIGEAAEHILGLSTEDADWLFGQYVVREDILDALDRLSEGLPARPSALVEVGS